MASQQDASLQNLGIYEHAREVFCRNPSSQMMQNELNFNNSRFQTITEEELNRIPFSTAKHDGNEVTKSGTFPTPDHPQLQSQKDASYQQVPRLDKNEVRMDVMEESCHTGQANVTSARKGATVVPAPTLGPSKKPQARPKSIARGRLCKLCGHTFARRAALSQHVLMDHVRAWEHRCDECGKRFDSLEQLHDHVQRHVAKDRPYRCNHCPSLFYHASDLLRHISAQHEPVAYHQCGTCGKRFARRDYLLGHEAAHSRRKRFDRPRVLGNSAEQFCFMLDELYVSDV